MNQRVLLADTKRRNQTIDRLANGVTAASKRPIVARGLTRQVGATHVEHLELQQLTLDGLRGNIVPNALQHFAEDQVSEAETLPVQLLVNPLGLGIPTPRK